MSNTRFYCVAAARAVRELDKCSLGAPESGQDKQDWQNARGLLCDILDRNGYELSVTGGKLLKKRAQGHR